MKNIKPELVAPGGSFEKAKIALLFGADAVYVSGPEFGLRKSADNLSIFQLEKIISLANSKGNKIYLCLNILPHNQEIKKLPKYLKIINRLKPHALIISDLGVFMLAKKMTSIPIHISTQASVCNSHTALFWKNLGAQRIILSRELTLKESQKIKKASNMEIEIFGHGAMCTAYSGKCVISNYTAKRDANRGGCIQNCRHEIDIYHSRSKKIQDTLYLMNSKDLLAIELLPEIIANGIDAIKIEGRMKSNLYLANSVSAYRKVIDNPSLDQDGKNQLEKVSNRTFCTGSLDKSAGSKSISYNWNGYQKELEYIGTIKEALPKNKIFIHVKAPFQIGDKLQILAKNGCMKEFKINKLFDLEGTLIKKALPNTIVQINHNQSYEPYSILIKTIINER